MSESESESIYSISSTQPIYENEEKEEKKEIFEEKKQQELIIDFETFKKFMTALIDETIKGFSEKLVR